VSSAAGENEPGVQPPPPDTDTERRDPLRRSRVSQAWISITVLTLLLVLLIVFFAQNTERVGVHFFGWTWHAPLAVVALTGVVFGMALTVIAGTLRIVQVHRRVRRESR
jgi:uncharacterized integral membrane protein